MPGPITAIATYWFAPVLGGLDGWTENFYVVANDLAAALAKAKTYVLPRRSPLHKTWYIETVRVSDINVLNDSLEASYYPQNSPGKFAIGNPEPADTCIYCRLEAGAARRRMMPLRGIPVDQLTPDNTFTPTAQYKAAIDVLGAWFIANQGTLLMQQVTKVLKKPGLCQPYQLDPRAMQFLADDVAFTVLDNQPIQITGIPQNAAYGYNGRWVVKHQAAAGQAIIMKPKRKHYVMGAPLGAVLNTLQFDYQDITNFLPERGGTRKTGRPFASPRGRQSATRH